VTSVTEMTTPISTSSSHVWGNFIHFSRALVTQPPTNELHFPPYCIMENETAENLNRILPADSAVLDDLGPLPHLLDYLQARRKPFVWFTDECQLRLNDALCKAGFFNVSAIDWLGMRLSRSKADGTEGVVPPELQIIQVANKKDSLQWIETCVGGYRFSAAVAERMKQALKSALSKPRDDTVLLLGLHNDEPVSTILMFVDGVACGFYWVATLPGFQRRGFGEAMMRHGMKILGESQSLREFVLQSTPEGIRLYQRLGFEKSSVIKLMLWKPR